MTVYPGRVLGIDYGTKRVGIAVSDPTRLLSQGVTTLQNDRLFWTRMKKILVDYDVKRIVVGMPYSLDGGKGKKATEVDDFIRTLRQHTDIPVETWDESFTSVAAHQVFRETGMKKKKRQQKHRVDEMAARLILQGYLDHHYPARKE